MAAYRLGKGDAVARKKLSKVERKARAAEKRSEIKLTILSVVKASLENGGSLEVALAAGDRKAAEMIRKNPRESTVIRHGAIMAMESLEASLKEAAEEEGDGVRGRGTT